MRVALFAPCFVDQLYPRIAIAALHVLQRLGVEVEVPSAAACCGQPPANAGFEADAGDALDRFVRTFASYERVVVLSGSCALHIRNHAGARGAVGRSVAAATMEFTGFLHDAIGVASVARLGGRLERRVAVHIGCHGLRGLGLATPTEIPTHRVDKVSAVLGAVAGVSFVRPSRPDECCGFGGTFAVAESAVSAKMGRDRLLDYASTDADAVVSTDPSCMMHLAGLARAQRGRTSVPFLHVAEFLAQALP
jgi:L-lactate dehydrogenase complex protein LldE